MSILPQTSRILMASGLLALMACAPSLRERIKPTSAIIENFRVLPERGQNPKFKLNEQVSFEGTLARDGFLTLITVDPDRTTVELERNVRLAKGKFVFPRGDDQVGNTKAAYVVVEPLGTQLVYAIYTDQASASKVRFNGVLSDNALEQRLRDFLEQTPGVQDVNEVRFEVVK